MAPSAAVSRPSVSLMSCRASPSCTRTRAPSLSGASDERRACRGLRQLSLPPRAERERERKSRTHKEPPRERLLHPDAPDALIRMHHRLEAPLERRVGRHRRRRRHRQRLEALEELGDKGRVVDVRRERVEERAEGRERCVGADCTRCASAREVEAGREKRAVRTHCCSDLREPGRRRSGRSRVPQAQPSWRA